MTNDAVPRPLNSKELYQLAMVEMDARNLPSLIDQANNAILDEIEHGNPTSLQGELALLNDALNGLRLLRREYERAFQEYRELRSRKLG